MVERAGEREDAGCADASEGRLEPDDAAEGSGDTDRAAGVAPEGERQEVGCERDGRAPARPARDAVRRPRVAARPEQEVDRGDPPGELVRLRLADEDRPGP